MPQRGQYKQGVDEEILRVLEGRKTPMETPVLIGKCRSAREGTIVDHLHRLARKGKIVKGTTPARGYRGYAFTWRLP